ncbi:GNAT family N-acetyltransferase [Isosphaeraceae bacterium EP7]
MAEGSQVEVRIATTADAHRVAHIGDASFRETFEKSTPPADMDLYLRSTYTESHIRDDMSEPRVTYLVAGVRGEMFGFAKVRECSETACVTARRPMELCRLYVLGEHAGRGVGAALMGACLDRAGSTGHDVVWLGVWQHNDRARRFYERWGFRRVGSQIFAVGSDDQLDDILELKIDEGPGHRSIR